VARSLGTAKNLARSTSFRTFVFYPLIVLGWELVLSRGRLRLDAWFVPLMLWGYLQYRLVGAYRLRHGGGGPGMKTLPLQLVTHGPYALCRNPMYLGHLVFLAGLTLSMRSVLAGVITLAVAVWFQFRVERDERRLQEYFGAPYVEYTRRVKRWIPRII
jgi:hypothetical protein